MPTDNKPTFADTVSELNKTRIKSNLSNLAHARQYAEQHIAELEDRLAKAKEVIIEINDLAPSVETGEAGSDAKVAEIYNKARGGN